MLHTVASIPRLSLLQCLHCCLSSCAEWAVPQMLRIVACIHALYTPAGRQALAPIGAALDMAPQVGGQWECLVYGLASG